MIVETRQPILVEDVRTDSRLAGALLVSTQGIVAVAGVPLTRMREAESSEPSTPWTTGRTAGRPPTSPCSGDLAAVATRLLDPDRTPAAAAPGVETSSEFVVDDDIIDLVPDYVAARRRDMVTLRQYLDAATSRRSPGSATT